MDYKSIIILAVGLSSVFTNGILLVILFLDPLKKFRTSTSFCIASLAISDLITGATGCSYAFHGKVNMQLVYGVIWFTIISSFGMIFMMSCERFVIVLYPLQAKSLITRKRVVVSIALNWMISAAVGGLIYYFYNIKGMPFNYLIFTCFSCILFLVLVLVAIYIAIIVRTKTRRTLLLKASIRGAGMVRMERRLTGVLLLLVIILLLTVIPYVASALVFSYCKIFEEGHIPTGLSEFAHYYFPVELVNFAVNPLIYAWRLPNYRNSLVYYLKRLSSRKKQAGHDSQQRRAMRNGRFSETFV